MWPSVEVLVSLMYSVLVGGWWRLALGSGGLWWYGSVVSGERLQFCVGIGWNELGMWGDYLRMGSQPLCFTSQCAAAQ